MAITIQEAAQMEGVKDLPMKIKAKFAKALVLESQGDTAGAEAALAAAVDAEAAVEAGKVAA